MSKTVVVFSCAHTDPDVSNERFDWLGEFLYDIKPDYVVDLGDFYDMRSLNTYDTRYPQAIVAQSYQRDVEHGNEAQDRIRRKFKELKRKRPRFIGFEGNHEYRLKKAISIDPRLEGDKYGISFNHLQTDYWYDEYHPYHNSAPAIATYDGVSYAHYFGAGNFGAAMSGDFHASNLIKKRHSSATCGHSHRRSVHFKDDAFPSPSIGLVVGCYKGKEENWAGQANNDWWKGVVVKREVENGVYEPEFVSLGQLKKAYA